MDGNKIIECTTTIYTNIYVFVGFCVSLISCRFVFAALPENPQGEDGARQGGGGGSDKCLDGEEAKGKELVNGFCGRIVL